MDLAQQDPKAYTSVASIAQRQEISVKYLEMIISILNKGGYLRSQMGKKGGYQLARSAQDYTVGEILRLTEGSLAPVSCLECEEEACGRSMTCLTLPMWKEFGPADWGVPGQRDTSGFTEKLKESKSG